ncbi:MAG: SPOR domain-containing protein [Candidatus Cryptobacteroides sp.]
MKRNLALVLTLLFSVFAADMARGQEIEVPEGYELVDSLVFRYADVVDTTLAGRDIFMVMPSRDNGDAGDVTVSQSPAVAGSMNAFREHNKTREMSGYRVRIFFDNHRTARAESEAALDKFTGIYHDVPAYRTYANPYFKVTVGDFRTKSEAMALLERIKADFPSAFVVKETIGFPVVDKDNAYMVDTVKVLRPKVSPL